MNIYTIKINAEIEIYANSDEEAIAEVNRQLLDDIADNARINILSNEEYN